jgi:hypothetical protein
VKAVRHLRGLGCTDIEFSPEDAGRSDPKFLYRILSAVIEAGATTLNIPDTTGKKPGAKQIAQPVALYVPESDARTQLSCGGSCVLPSRPELPYNKNTKYGIRNTELRNSRLCCHPNGKVTDVLIIPGTTADLMHNSAQSAAPHVFRPIKRACLPHSLRRCHGEWPLNNGDMHAIS